MPWTKVALLLVSGQVLSEKNIGYAIVVKKYTEGDAQIDLLPVLVNIPGFLQPLHIIPLSCGTRHAVVYPWVDGIDRWYYSVPEMDVRDRCCLWRYMMQTVATMHERGIAHGDIKPANFVLPRTQPLQPVLIDHETVHAPQRDPRRIRYTECYNNLDAVDGFAQDRYALGASMAHCLVGFYTDLGNILEDQVNWLAVLERHRCVASVVICVDISHT